MTIRELARTAWMEIAAHKTRSAMTCLSLAIGVAAMLFTFSQTAGQARRFAKAVELYGPGRITIKARRGYKSLGRSSGLTYADLLEIRREFPNLYMAYPAIERYQSRARFNGLKSENIQITGTTEEWRLREWIYTLRGRFLNRRDIAAGARVCVLIQSGGWVKKPWWARYFPERLLDKFLKTHELLGKQILLNDHIFTVVGVIKEPPRDRDPRWFHSSSGQDGTFLVPISTYYGYIAQGGDASIGRVDALELDTNDASTVGPTLRKLQALLRQRHYGEDDVEVKDFREILGGAMTELKNFIISIMIIGVIAVLASGIGIMNVTLATIFSRVREIGIRRSLGATRSDIVWQFVAEAMALGLAGGAAGTAIGIAGITFLAPREDRMLAVGVVHILGALAIALGTGFLFSLYPAYKASRFDPIEALRYE